MPDDSSTTPADSGGIWRGLRALLFGDEGDETLHFAGATLQYGSDYTVAFVTVGAGDVLNFIPVSVKYVDYIESPVGSGTYVPSANYGGTGNFNATTLYPDFNGDGYFEADSNAADIAFVATFQTVPEPTTLASVGVLATLTRRRRRAHR